MVRITTYHAKASREVYVPRSCSNCGHSWNAVFTAVASVQAENYSDKAIAKARESAEREVVDRAKMIQKNDSKQVLCEKCKHFSVDAMNAYFSNGYKEGILQTSRDTAKRRIVMGLTFSLLSAVLIAAFIWKVPNFINLGLGLDDAQLVQFEYIGLFVFTVISIVFAIWALAKGAILISECDNIEKVLGAKSDEELLKIAVIAYHANNDSLKPGDPWVESISKTLRLEGQSSPELKNDEERLLLDDIKIERPEPRTKITVVLLVILFISLLTFLLGYVILWVSRPK